MPNPPRMAVQVFCDRHYGGINYPRGGVGRIAELLVEGLQEHGSHIEYKANVSALTCLDRAASSLVEGLQEQSYTRGLSIYTWLAGALRSQEVLERGVKIGARA